MAAVPPAPTLPCKECDFVNEPERVYCHNCGAKLDRSLLPKEDQLRREPPERARKRIMRMTNPGGGAIKAALWNLAKTLVFSSLAAVCILMLQEPDGVPSSKPELSSRLVASELTQLMASPQARALAFTQAEVNSFLASGKVKKEGSVPGVLYKRAFANFESGTCRISIERTVWGFSVFAGTLYRAEATGGVYYATNLGGNLGRLPLHPLLMKYVDPILFGDLAEGLKPEYAAVRKAFYLRLEKAKVTIATAGGAK